MDLFYGQNRIVPLIGIETMPLHYNIFVGTAKWH